MCLSYNHIVFQIYFCKILIHLKRFPNLNEFRSLSFPQDAIQTLQFLLLSKLIIRGFDIIGYLLSACLYKLFNLRTILSQTKCHIILKFRNGEVNIDFIWINHTKDAFAKRSDETSLIILDHVFEIISYKSWFEVS